MTTRDVDLRLLLVTKGLDIGGIERMVVGLAVGLTRRGITTEVAVVNGERDRLIATLDRAAIVVHRLGGNDRIGLRGLLGLVRLVRSRRYDVIHVHGPLVAVVMRLIPGIAPIVTTAHTPIEALHPLTRWAWKLTRRRDTSTIAVASRVESTLGSRARVIPYGVDLDAAAAAVDAAARADRAADEPMVLIAVASHRKVKNYPNLFAAVRVARDRGANVRVEVIGEGPELEANVACAAALGVDDIITFRTPALDVLQRIAAADVLVVASDYEGQPMVVAEALAVGTPVIATDVGRVSELVDAEVGRVVPVGDSSALAAAIVDLAASPEMRRGMGAAGRLRSSHWTLANVIDAHLDVYGDVHRAAHMKTGRAT